MTYLHALQYLDGSPSSRSPSREEDALLSSAYTAALLKETPRFLCLLFASDRTGVLSAALCRSALMAGGVRVGEIGDAAAGPLEQVLRIDGAPVPPPVLRELCHLARATEQRLSGPRRRATHAEEDGVPPSPVVPDAAVRCGTVLSRLFSDAGCRVLLLIGDVHHPRLRVLAHRSPQQSICVLSAGEHKALQRFPKGTREVICPTCPPAVFRRVTDACSRAGSRLTLPTTAHLSVRDVSRFRCTLSYRGLRDCSLQSGIPAMTRLAVLSAEALLALERLGCGLTPQQIAQGFSKVAPPLLFAPVSIEPLLIAHAITDADDTDALLDALAAHDDTLPHPRCIRYVSLPEAERARLAAACDTICAADAPTDTDPLSPTAAQGTHILVGTPAELTAVIAQYTHALRRL